MRRDIMIALSIWCLVFIAHSLSPIATSSDSFWTVPVLVSILAEHNTNLDEYSALLRQKRYQSVDCVNADYTVSLPDVHHGCPPGSHYYNRYPIALTWLALPPMLAMDACLRIAGPLIDWTAGSRLTPVELAFVRRRYLECHALVEIVLASAIVAVAAALMFLTGRLWLGIGASTGLALQFAFCTSAWSTASRALWQAGPAMLMLSAALYLIARAKERPALLAWSSVPLVIGYFTRPPLGIALVLIGVFVFAHERPQIKKWVLLALATASPFVIYNLWIYHIPLQAYFTHRLFLAPTAENLGAIANAFAGLGVSPSRGLFVFTPFLLFSLAGIYLAFRTKWMTPLVYYLAAALVLHWTTIALFPFWTAGHCYGPRYFTEVLPLFLFFLIPVFPWLRLGRPLRVSSMIFYLTVAISFFIHFRGATTFAVYQWNSIPEEMNVARVWDWRDPQFLRGIWHNSRE